ncbi:MAG: glycosyltransferase [Roseobacter sp.]
MQDAGRHAPLRIMVAALTRRRPDMLKTLLGSWIACDLPENASVQFLIVENDEAPRCEQIVHAFAREATDRSIHYVHEPEPGIPFGRNRAAREAVACAADLLAFVDDDESVGKDWLVQIVNAHRQSGAVLIGGPVRVKESRHDLSFLQRLMQTCVVRRYQRKEQRAARLAGLEGTPGVTIVTNNWLGETSLFSAHGMWFDEDMRFTGGSDAKFCAQIRSKGLPTAWAKGAVVYEEIAPERLGIGYQFKRARDQSSTHYARKASLAWRAALDFLVLMPAKTIAFAFLVFALPFTGGRTLLQAVRTGGWIAGRFEALAGRKSDHYKAATGD